MSEIKLGTNVPVEFQGVKAGLYQKMGREKVSLDIYLSNGFRARLFDPENNYRLKKEVSTRVHLLFDVLGADYYEVPNCHGDFGCYVDEVSDLLKPYIGFKMFAKVITGPPKSSRGGEPKNWPILGEGRCFSQKPDMELTETDRLYYTPVEDNNIEEQDMPI